jgi:hypothetical protein
LLRHLLSTRVSAETLDLRAGEAAVEATKERFADETGSFCGSIP